MTQLEQLKFNLRESTHPWFSESELTSLLEKNNNNVTKATYEGLIIKSESQEFKTGDTLITNDPKYWLRLAKRYRGNFTGTIRRVDER